MCSGLFDAQVASILPSDVTFEELCIYRLGGDAPRRVTTTPGQEAYPSWQPATLTLDREAVE